MDELIKKTEKKALKGDKKGAKKAFKKLLKADKRFDAKLDKCDKMMKGKRHEKRS